MKRFFSCLIAATAIGVAGGVLAQGAFPERPVKILVGFPAASTADIVARVLAPEMGELLGQPVVVEDRAGAGSAIAAEAVLRSPADGHTLLLSTIANPILGHVVKLSFNFERDFAPVALLAETPGLLAAHPSAPPTLKDLIAAAKAKPGEIQYASAGTGTVTHLYGELFNLAAGVKLTHVPYKGSGQAQTDLVAGRIKLLFTPAATVVPHIKAGRLIALGSIGRTQMSVLPGVPRLVDAGVSGFETGLWFGLNAPAATPRSAIERINQACARALAAPEVLKRFAAQDIQALGGTSEGFGTLIRQESEKWARVVKSAGIKGE